MSAGALPGSQVSNDAVTMSTCGKAARFRLVRSASCGPCSTLRWGVGCRGAPSVGRCALAGGVASEVACVFDQFFDLFGGVLAPGVDLGCFSIDGIDVSVVGVFENSIIRHVLLLVVAGGSGEYPTRSAPNRRLQGDGDRGVVAPSAGSAADVVHLRRHGRAQLSRGSTHEVGRQRAAGAV